MLADKIDNDLKEAMKQRDTIRVSALRMVKAAIKNASIAKQKELEDADVQQVLGKIAKQHKDSIEQFKKANRQDLVDKETKELKIIEGYLPEQLSEEEIRALVDEAIKQTGAQDKKDTGRVMSSVMPKLKGKADGKLVMDIVTSRLTPEQKNE